MFYRIVLMVSLLLPAAPAGASSATTGSPPDHAPALAGQVIELAVHGTALEGNRFGDSAERQITVYLPPSYARASGRRYPVIYSLGGFRALPALAAMPGMSPRDTLIRPLDQAIASGRLGEVILVQVEGYNRLGGSFWTNSDSTGRWEDFLTRDVVTTVDRRLRTVPRRDHRGLYGGSMGGFGALSIAMHRPELFGTVFAQSPCCLALVDELGPTPGWPPLEHLTLEQADAAFGQGDPRALEAMALAAALAPDPQRAPFYGDLPYRADDAGHVVRAEPAWSRWAAQLPPARLDKEAAGLRTLRGLRLQYGDHDELHHIVTSLPAFDRALTAHHVPHELHVDHGGHVDFARFGRDAVPFFARTLAGAAAPASTRVGAAAAVAGKTAH